MGTITCVVNADNTLTFTSISGTNPSNTWAKFQVPSFQLSGGGTFSLAFSAPFSDFQFNPSTPIVWTGGQPSWIQISSATETALTLAVNSSQSGGNSSFTITNVTTGGQSIAVNVKTTGGSGGAGGMLEVYLEDDATALIGPMPAGALATGGAARFGFRDPGEQEIVLTPGEGVGITGVTWTPSQPSYIQQNQSNGQFFILVNNVVGNPPEEQFADFVIDLGSLGILDPTIITNPDESGPEGKSRDRD